MEFIEQGVLIVHVLVSLGLIGLVMIQQGKGAEAGASFGGGASQTVFGSQGTGSFLTKVTKYLAIIFFTTSLSLAVIAKQKSEVTTDEGLSIVPPAEEMVSGSDPINEAISAEAKLEDKPLELEVLEEASSAPELE